MKVITEEVIKVILPTAEIVQNKNYLNLFFQKLALRMMSQLADLLIA
jgi:hypothetical protein